MSPAPARTSNDAIVAAARRILEADGLSAVTMRSVAEAVGVKGPSLLQAGAGSCRLAASRLGQRRRRPGAHHVQGDETGDPRADLRAAAVDVSTLRGAQSERLQAAVRRPAAGRQSGPRRRWPHWAGRSSTRWPDSPVESEALEGARTIVAWAHGFVTMELAGAFRLGGRPRRRLRVRDRRDPDRRQRAGDPSVRLSTKRMRNTPRRERVLRCLADERTARSRLPQARSNPDSGPG